MENNFYVAFYEAGVCQCDGGTPLTYFLTWEQPGTCECFQKTAPCLGGCSTNIFKVFCAMCERSKARTWLCHIFHPTCLSALYLCPQEPSSTQMHIEQAILFILISLGIYLQISSKIKLASSVPKKKSHSFLSPISSQENGHSSIYTDIIGDITADIFKNQTCFIRPKKKSTLIFVTNLLPGKWSQLYSY